MISAAARLGFALIGGWLVVGPEMGVAGVAWGQREPTPPAGLSRESPFRLFRELTGPRPPRLISYSPSQLDPRNPANQNALATTSLQNDLKTLKAAGFDGLILYGYNESVGPRIAALAKIEGFTILLPGIWDLRSSNEIDGVAKLVQLHRDDFALGVVVGNEGITFGRYEPIDLEIAAARLRAQLPPGIPLTTSEPLGSYDAEFVRTFGDFLAPNIHPVFDQPELNPVQAASWTRTQAADLAQRAGKPVLVKETGFPHAGKPSYTPETQKQFWEAYLRPGLLARDPGHPDLWRYHGVAFEAFDLPWKAEASQLPIEKSWGLFDNNRRPQPALEVWRISRPR